MGFNTNTASRNTGNDDSWKSQAFVNLYLPTADGGKIKLGETGVALKLSRKTDAAIIKRLTEGGQDALDAMKGVLTLEFRLVDDPKAKPVALGF